MMGHEDPFSSFILSSPLDKLFLNVFVSVDVFWWRCSVGDERTCIKMCTISDENAQV